MDALKTSLARVASIALRHSIAAGVLVLVSCATWTLVYVSLLLWAVIVDGGIGSPVVYPIGLLLAVGGSVLAALFCFFPSALAGECLCRWRGWPVLVGIPVTFGMFCLVCLGWCATAWSLGGPESPSLGGLTLGCIAMGALPLGLYWWVAEFPQLILQGIKAVVALLRARSARDQPPGCG